jgi:hypothetical protein
MGSHALVYTKKYVYEKLLQRLFCKFKIKTYMCKVILGRVDATGSWPLCRTVTAGIRNQLGEHAIFTALTLFNIF